MSDTGFRKGLFAEAQMLEIIFVIGSFVLSFESFVFILYIIQEIAMGLPKI